MAKKQVTEETAEAIVEAVIDAINEITQEEVVPAEQVAVSGLKPEHQVGHQSRSFKTPIQK